MSEEVKPFTAEEWANDGLEVIDGYVDMEMGVVDVSFFWTADDPCDRETRLLAALALQRAGPGGGPLFTWEMVDAIREVAEELKGLLDENYSGAAAGELSRKCALAAKAVARLASTLPPRKEP